MFPPAFDPHTLGLAAPLCVDATPPRCAQYVIASAICKGPAGQYFCMFSSDGTAGASLGGDAGPPFRLGHELVGAVYVLETHSALAPDSSVSRNTVTRPPESPTAETCSVQASVVALVAEWGKKLLRRSEQALIRGKSVNFCTRKRDRARHQGPRSTRQSICARRARVQRGAREKQ